MLVMKFGGSSIASSDNISNVREIIAEKTEAKIIVVSAFSGTTDMLQSIANDSLSGNSDRRIETIRDFHFDMVRGLIDLSDQSTSIIFVQKQIIELENLCRGVNTLQELSDKSLARILSIGERISSFIIHKYLNQEGIGVTLLDSQALIKANGNFLNAELQQELTKDNIIQAVNKEEDYIVPGFISSNANGETVLLGRGGSDYTAAIYADAVKATRMEIWTDVNGMLTADPRAVKTAGLIKKLSYKEAFELSHFGANVLFPPAIRPVMQNNIPVYLKNTFMPKEPGTLIGNQATNTKDNIIGISSLSDVSILTVSGVGMAGSKGMARRVFMALENADVNAILITQCSSEQSICIGINDNEAQKSVNILQKEFQQDIDKMLVDEIDLSSEYSIIALVGDQMKQKAGLSGKAFSVLGENGINITAIAQGSSERNISMVINKKDEKKAVNVLHERFFHGSTKKVHLFIAGVGNVGSEFLHIIEKQHAKLLSGSNIDLKVVGVANSNRMLVNEEGIKWQDIKCLKDNGIPYNDFSEFVEVIRSMNKRNSIFIDNTASELVSSHYAAVLNESVSVITCNKIACSSNFDNYSLLKKSAKDKNCQFKYETCVGAALPVIRTIQDLLLSGDELTKMQAVLSGSLNYIFNNYDGSEAFVHIVKKALEEGFTEPNPLVDLSGVDVMRKILILARETGSQMEMGEIQCDGFLPDECLRAKDADELFACLEKNEDHFNGLFLKAHNNGNKLKVVATYCDNSASVGLEEVGPDSPYYHLEGKDNILTINSARYPDEPLVIKGAGAGAAVTASGVFSDLMLILNK